MKNKEKYAKEIIEIVCDGRILGVNKVTGKPTVCGNISCEECLRCDGRNTCAGEVLREWAEAEYIEKPVISKKDRAFLEYLKEESKYIVRHKYGTLFTYKDGLTNWFSLNRIFDVDFPMVKSSDSEPWLIEDLKKLEVVDEY